MNKYASVRPFWIATADALLPVFENVHYAAHCSEILDLIVYIVHASLINTTIHSQLKRYGSPNVSVAQHTLSQAYFRHLELLKESHPVRYQL